MHGAVFGTLVTFVILLVASVFLTPLALIPAALLAVFFLIGGPLSGMIRAGDRTGGDTPSTGDAAYDPVGSPSDQPSS